ncbi:MAG: hypothetical protein QXX36_01745 [Candidatus Rehaiarchaeum fermentans]|nr:hypothetical protein [Candidatus Rehaiarchaeum fermentans]MCW1297487.1 hypothetical protein [Candidatus Rehaiarchaeum fermentans]MCW1302328.1 hypothetical protein [Candidatus Rehaiarchaeum fermentans]
MSELEKLLYSFSISKDFLFKILNSLQKSTSSGIHKQIQLELGLAFSYITNTVEVEYYFPLKKPIISAKGEIFRKWPADIYVKYNDTDLIVEVETTNWSKREEERRINSKLEKFLNIVDERRPMFLIPAFYRNNVPYEEIYSINKNTGLIPAYIIMNPKKKGIVFLDLKDENLLYLFEKVTEYYSNASVISNYIKNMFKEIFQY